MRFYLLKLVKAGGMRIVQHKTPHQDRTVVEDNLGLSVRIFIIRHGIYFNYFGIHLKLQF